MTKEELYTVILEIGYKLELNMSDSSNYQNIFKKLDEVLDKAWKYDQLCK